MMKKQSATKNQPGGPDPHFSAVEEIHVTGSDEAVRSALERLLDGALRRRQESTQRLTLEHRKAANTSETFFEEAELEVKPIDQRTWWIQAGCARSDRGTRQSRREGTDQGGRMPAESIVPFCLEQK